MAVKTKHLVPLVAAVFLTFPSLQTFAEAPISFEVLVTFDYPGAFETVANAINNRGDVGGWCAVNPRTWPKGFVRLADGQFSVPLKTPASESGSTYLEGINDSGTACGYYSGASGQPGFLHSDRTFTTITVGGASFTYLESVNDAGDYCGVTILPNAAFVNIGGTTTNFSVPGADATGAYGINNLDQVVGTYSVGSNSFGYRRDADGTLQNPFAVPGMSYTSLRGINDRGWMVGSAAEQSGVDTHAVLFNARGAFALYDYPGAAWTYFTGINNGGFICGTYGDDTGVHGFIVQATTASTE